MERKVLRVESLERRELMAGVCSGAVAVPVMTQECAQVQACDGDCVGPIQEQLQTQLQTQDRTQLQTQLQTQDQTQLQTQLQTRAQLNDAAIESLTADSTDPLRLRSGADSGSGDCDRDRTCDPAN